MSNESKNDAFLAPWGNLYKGIRQNYPTERRFSDCFPQISQIITEADIRHSVFSIFSYFCPVQMAQISADGFLPLFAGRCPTLNATRPLALDGFCAADGADKRGWVLTSHSLPLAVGRCPTLNAPRPLALDGKGRKIFRLCIQVRPCTFNFQFSTLH